jgi:hypothetical protein
MPKKWENNWGGIVSLEGKTNRNRKLLTLGNLAIITGSLNSSIRDANWQTKCEGKPGRPGLNIYAAGLTTLDSYLSLHNWTEAEISNRADVLYGESVRIWPAN